MIKVTSRITKVYIDRLCGTWTIYCQDIFGDEFKIAVVKTHTREGREAAEEYAKKMEKILVNPQEADE